MLEEGGYFVASTGDLGGAVDLIERFPPDLLVTDLYVAEISGHEAAQYLKKKCETMRVLFVAGLPQDDRIETKSAVDGYEYFPNLFRGEDLLEKVARVLQSSHHSTG
jgi:CheY-like chemotaxis protein